MATEQDRIRLAEAMGWRNCEPKGYVNVDGVPTVTPAGEPPPFDQPPYIAALPDPFTDANDDYAVLEWIHADSTDFGTSQRIMKKLVFAAHQYRVGDYARAALEVIDAK